ncbi:MAG: nucleoside deaminase [Planctomycetes bacterium]|nr:nucleoside deaminase [Planctomycetota bacterium]
MDHMRAAARLALRGVKSNQGGPFGAVIVRGDVVVGRGFNRVLGTHDPTAHAEIVAIRQACRKLGTFSLAGCTLYASSEPCPMCLAAIHWARIERVWFACDRQDAARAGFDDAFLYEEFERAPRDRRLPVAQVFREEGLAAFQAWLAKPDRVTY